MSWPVVIQGGMGVGVSDWRLAQAVSRTGQLGVVSGTALDVILARRLQDGDPGGHMRRGLDAFPVARIAERIRNRYFVEGGRPRNRPYRPLPLHAHDNPRDLVELCIAANFVEVWLARQGHDHPVGINYLEKIQLPHLPSIYGALLAGVGYILMGAGIPLKIPGAIEQLVRHEPAVYPLSVTNAEVEDDTLMRFDPATHIDGLTPPLARPRFLAIVSSHVLAATLLKRATGTIDGFVVEGPTAGGHNAPPRGRLHVNDQGEPVYGERDHVDLDKMRSLGVPFWLAGGYGTPVRLREAIAAGAQGIQAGTAFALSDESGLRDDFKQRLRVEALTGKARVYTDPLASPTAFPLKVVQLAGTLSDAAIYDARARVCDLGYLREAFRQPDGTVGFRCPAEPVSAYVEKGGTVEDTVGRKCICNALVATMGLGQVRGQTVEPPIVTSGNAITDVAIFMPRGRTGYSAADVVHGLLEAVPS
jgi:nitronate monooxygenase